MDISKLPAEILRSRVLNSTESALFCGLDIQMWRKMNKGGLVPKPLKLSERKLGWRIGDLQDWVDRHAEDA